MTSLFPYKWYLKNGYPAKGVNFHGCKAFGTFVCGGGSSMGYKLAGYKHLGGVEIDKDVANVYRKNHDPKYLFIEDIRAFNKREDLPKDLYKLDLLDGSPPCSSFSISGNREKDWGKNKKFTEGQSAQRLDDLVFEYIFTIKKLRPKVALLENVKGLISGNAKAYAKKLYNEFSEAGYRVQVFLLNAATMGVPQKRSRVFFIGLRNDLVLPKLNLSFKEQYITYGDIRIINDKGEKWTELDERVWQNKRDGDKDYSDVLERLGEGKKNWNAKFIYDKNVCNTIASSEGTRLVSFSEKKRLSDKEIKMCGSFPLDYNFLKIRVNYLVGMSVPPVMIAHISRQIWAQWLSKL